MNIVIKTILMIFPFSLGHNLHSKFEFLENPG